MDKMAVHVGKKRDLRIAVAKEGSYLCIRGYDCKVKCEKCSLHRVGEDLENLNAECEYLRGVKPILDLKIEFHVSEKITFV